MDKPRFVHKVGGRGSLSIVWVAVVVLVVCMGVVSAQTGRLTAPTVKYLMQEGQRLYDEGAYSTAEEILRQASDYQDSLEKADQKKLARLLDKAHEAVTERESATKNLSVGRDLALQGKSAEARVYLKKVKDNRYLTDEERQEVKTLLETRAASEESKSFLGMSLPFMSKRSSDNSETTATEVVAQGETATETPKASVLNHFDTAPMPSASASTPAGQGSYIEQIKQQREIIRGHVQSVINETHTKVEQAKQTGEFELAEDAISKARFQVQNNTIHLGAQRVEIYNRQLDEMAQSLSLAQDDAQWREEQDRIRRSLDDQHKQQVQRDIENQRTIIELLERAKRYRSERKFEAALTQLDKVLLIEPNHYEARLLRDEVQDLIFIARSRDLDTESETERVKTLLGNKEALIPRYDLVTFAKDWQDIVAKPTRQPDRPVELDPKNMAIYDRLERVVNLTDFSPDMMAGDAFDLLRNSVNPPLPIVVLWKDLYENADIDDTTPIDLDAMYEVTLATALESLCQALSGALAEIGYVVDGGVVKVGSVDLLPKKLVTRIYDISDFASQNRMMNMMNIMMPMRELNMVSNIMDQSRDKVEDLLWSPGTSSGGSSSGSSSSSSSSTSSSSSMGMMGGSMGGSMGGMMGGSMGGMMGGMMGGSMGGMMGGSMGGMMGGSMGGSRTGSGSRGSSSMMVGEIGNLIQSAIAPDSWYATSDYGQGTITGYPQMMRNPRKLAITQTPEVHKEIENFLKELRKSIGPQVAIETRFLSVSKNFVEEIGLDMDMVYNAGGKWGSIGFDQDSMSGAIANATDVAGSLGGAVTAGSVAGQYGTILDDLQVAFLINATQGRSDSKTLDAPRATTMNNETAIFNVAKGSVFGLPPETSESTTYTTGGATVDTTSYSMEYQNVITGNTLLVTPTISNDKKNVLLNVNMVRSKITDIKSQEANFIDQGEVVTIYYTTPDVERIELSTRVSVPDKGTLLLGGQRITEEVEKEVGVPVLSKVPILGRLFRNNSSVKDEYVLLLLVKPTIIFPEEAEQDALKAMEVAEAHAF